MKKLNKKQILLLGGILLIIIVSISVGVLIINKNNNTLSKEITTTITLDINPSIKIELNKDKKVINIIPLNNDAKEIITFDYLGKNIDTVVTNIITNIIDKNHIEEEITIIVGVTGEIKDNEIKTLLEDKLKNTNKEYNVIIPTITENSKQLADKYNITESKASYLEEIINKNKDLQLEEIKDMSIKEINTKIEELKKEEENKEKENKSTETTTNTNNTSGIGTVQKCDYVNIVLTNEEAGKKVANMMGATVATGAYCDKLPPESVMTLSSNGTCAYKVTFKYRTKSCIYYIGVETGTVIEGPSCTNTLVEEGEAQCIIMNSLGETKRENVHLKNHRSNASEWIYDLEDVYGTPDENGNLYIYEYHVSKYTGEITSKQNIGILE